MTERTEWRIVCAADNWVDGPYGNEEIARAAAARYDRSSPGLAPHVVQSRVITITEWTTASTPECGHDQAREGGDDA